MILLLGKNGSGKTYITSELEKRGIKRSVSYTTRPKRPGEINNVDYVFVTREEFERRLQNGEFIEHKVLFGNYYGTPKVNLETSDIVLSGGTISPEILPYIEGVYFIDSPLTMRYEGMLVRNLSSKEMFERVHGENDEFLFDAKARIFTNIHQHNIVDMVYQSIRDKDIEKAKSFREFLAKAVESYKEQDHLDKSHLLQFLNYEEYLLRKLYLEGKLSREQYDENIIRYLVDHHITFTAQKDKFDIAFDGTYTECRKLVKKNGSH